jgi:hypothetical protein
MANTITPCLHLVVPPMRFACGPLAYLKNPREKCRKQWIPYLTVKDNRTCYSEAEYTPENSGLNSF